MGASIIDKRINVSCSSIQRQVYSSSTRVPLVFAMEASALAVLQSTTNFGMRRVERVSVIEHMMILSIARASAMKYELDVYPP